MTLLTRAEYAAIAADLDPPRAAFIDGRYRVGSGGMMATINPATGETIAEIAACNAKDVDFAVGKAREAFDRGVWATLHPSERKDVLIRLCKLITRNRRELAVMESLDSGKPIRDCEEIDIPEAIHCIKWHAEAADKLYDRTAPAGDDAMAMIVREPVGVVGAVLPWNFPLLMLAWKIGPALASGNSVIVGSCGIRPTATSRKSCWNAAGKTRRSCWRMPKTSTSWPGISSMRPSGTWAKTAPPPRA